MAVFRPCLPVTDVQMYISVPSILNGVANCNAYLAIVGKEKNNAATITLHKCKILISYTMRNHKPLRSMFKSDTFLNSRMFYSNSFLGCISFSHLWQQAEQHAHSSVQSERSLQDSDKGHFLHSSSASALLCFSSKS